MKLIVNTNRIMAALVKDSYSRKIILEGRLELITINILEKELVEYKQFILKKANISEDQFNLIYGKLKEKLTLLEDVIIENKMKEAKSIMDRVDKDDTPFIAAALSTKSDIWSDDKHFEKQNRVKVWKTKDLIKYI